MSAFEELGVLPEIIKAVEDLDWSLPTPVQAETIPLVLGGGDAMVSAETGSGKTGAFCLPLVQVCYETLQGKFLQITKQPNHNDKSTSLWFKSDYNLIIDREQTELENKLPNRWQGARASLGANNGRWYFEVKVLSDGLCRVGWATEECSLDLGTDSEGLGYGGTGKKSHNREFANYGEPYGEGDIIGCFIDFEESRLFFSKNGTILQTAFEIPAALKNCTFYPSVCLKKCRVQVNFGPVSSKNFMDSFRMISESPLCIEKTYSTGDSSKRKKNRRGPLALILEPSRELALQVKEEIGKFSKYLSPTIRCACLVGGEKISQNIHALDNGVEVVCGTLGRIQECIEGGHLVLSSLRFLVLDEADAFLHQNQMESIIGIYSRVEEQNLVGGVQVLFFSATLHSPEVHELSEKIQQSPMVVDMKGRDYVPEEVEHSVFFVDPSQNTTDSKDFSVHTDGVHEPEGQSTLEEWSSQRIKQMKTVLVRKLIESFSMEQALIFVRTQLDADNLHHYLKNISLRNKSGYGKDERYSSVVLHGGISARERKANLQNFKSGEARFLICTDVAARGIDVEGVPYLINVTLPDNVETYVHRVGRVGRSERLGLAISLVATINVRTEGCCLKEAVLFVITLDSSFQLPVDNRKHFGYQSKEMEAIAAIQKKVDCLKPITTAVIELEDQVQKNFLALSHRFSLNHFNFCS
ncbi:Probable ATP-dependent RNA helicase ddx1 [Galdieria sulphuraria]|nr:Probable ATP-dependent RNA helicase ddx1 [Galdieria sulphuraria]